jgi:hypothetical protein
VDRSWILDDVGILLLFGAAYSLRDLFRSSK